MFLLYEYDIFWLFLIISSVIPVLGFLIFGSHIYGLDEVMAGEKKLQNPIKFIVID